MNESLNLMLQVLRELQKINYPISGIKTMFHPPAKERGLNKMQNFILYLASLSFIRRGIEGEVSQGHKLYVI